MNSEMIARRRAIEALRAGVPNRDVVRLLPPEQRDLARNFRRCWRRPSTAWTTGSSRRACCWKAISAPENRTGWSISATWRWRTISSVSRWW